MADPSLSTGCDSVHTTNWSGGNTLKCDSTPYYTACAWVCADKSENWKIKFRNMSFMIFLRKELVFFNDLKLNVLFPFFNPLFCLVGVFGKKSLFSNNIY